jgi:hypothetical protein
MYDYSHQWIGNPLTVSEQTNRKPIGERASSKLKVRGSAPLYAATKPKARSPMGFLLSASPVLRTIARVQPDCAEGKGTWYVVRLGGSSRIIHATGRIIKSRGIRRIRSMMMPLGGEAPSPFYSIGVGGSLGEIIHKREYKGCV